MREVTFSVTKNGAIEPSHMQIGHAGEHNATTLYATLPAILCESVEYFRLAIGSYLTEQLYATDNTLSYTLPQCVLISGTQFLQIEGYKHSNEGELLLVFKSDIALVDVLPSIDPFNEITNEVQQGVDGALGKLHYYVTKSDDLAAEIRQNTTECARIFTNINQIFSSKADKATTLEGYGITDAYTKSETDEIKSTANEALNIAKGKSQAYVFDTKSDLDRKVSQIRNFIQPIKEGTFKQPHTDGMGDYSCTVKKSETLQGSYDIDASNSHPSFPVIDLITLPSVLSEPLILKSNYQLDIDNIRNNYNGFENGVYTWTIPAGEYNYAFAIRLFGSENITNFWATLSKSGDVAPTPTTSVSWCPYNVGDNLYIKDTNVPDYWWDGLGISELETQKVDLTEYYTKVQTNSMFNALNSEVNNVVNNAFMDLENRKANKPVRQAFTDGDIVYLADNVTFYAAEPISTITVDYPSGDFISSLEFDLADEGDITITLPQSKYVGGAPAFANGETWELNIKNGVVVGGLVE